MTCPTYKYTGLNLVSVSFPTFPLIEPPSRNFLTTPLPLPLPLPLPPCRCGRDCFPSVLFAHLIRLVLLLYQKRNLNPDFQVVTPARLPVRVGATLF
ncbi:hypothetical protein EJD97_009140 [Solanum chilense]|uniref:Uncharacterized protein n=1 Tax=Solanum chilense TaxID=4083 RepID=A0A6N2CKL3_SOLCI|nr:hypothetical protein EJD97_009140 [Solanum chilense]